jgi:hypothetical protein
MDIYSCCYAVWEALWLTACHAIALLSKGQGYAQYAAHGRSEVVDVQAVIRNDALNSLAIMLPSFRASHEGEQHADDLSQNPSELRALPG